MNFRDAPEAVEAHRHLADLYADELNDNDQAIAQYEALLKIENLPDRPEILFKRADLFLKKEDYDRALRELRALEESGIGELLADQVSLKIGNIYRFRRSLTRQSNPLPRWFPRNIPNTAAAPS